MSLPRFATGRLLLRPRALEDLDELAAMDADPEVMRWIGPGTVPEPVAHRAALVERIARDHGPGLGVWTVVAREEPDRFLGWVALHPLPGWEPDIEIGWRFRRAAWGCGYATEAARALLGHGFATLALPHIVAVVQDGNTASQAVAASPGRPTACCSSPSGPPLRAAGRRCVCRAGRRRPAGRSRPCGSRAPGRWSGRPGAGSGRPPHT